MTDRSGIHRRQFLAGVSGVAFAAPEGPLPIDVGRQLFVDDYLIAETSMRRVFHKARIHEASPILKPETPLEMNNGYCPVACPFQDGVFYDPKDRLYKMWYQAGWFDGTGYAYSEDGIRWVRPNLDVEPGTNRVLPARAGLERDGAGVWLDQATPDAAERFKLFVYHRQYEGPRTGALIPGKAARAGATVYTSPDGIHWNERGPTGPCGDNTNFYYNPFRKTWFYSIRTNNRRGRVRSYRECSDFVKGATWTPDDVIFYASADDGDLPDPQLGYATQLYNLDAVGYESLMLGVFAIHRGPPNEICEKGGFPKITDLALAYSRDGVHWDRPDRTAFLECSRKPGTWDRGYLHSSGGVCLIVGDELRFYLGAFSGVSPQLGGHMYAGGSTGLATLRRDGFASMNAGAEGGTLTTRPVVFNGHQLFVNANAHGGELSVEVIGPDRKVVPALSRANCRVVRADGTRQAVVWKDRHALAAMRGRPVAFRFHATNAQLFAVWISPDESGASHGYVAAGGPGFSGPTDTI